MQWSAAPHAGFSPAGTPATWLPVHPGYRLHNVETELNDPGSRLAFYRRLLRLRRSSPALHSGSIEVLPLNDQVISYRRSHPDDEPFVIAANLSDEAAAHSLEGQVVTGTDHLREGRVFSGQLGPWEAVVVRPARDF